MKSVREEKDKKPNPWQSFLIAGLWFSCMAATLYLHTFFQQAFSGTRFFEFLWPAAGYGFHFPAQWLVEGFAQKMTALYAGAAGLVLGWAQNSIPEPQFTLVKSVLVVPILKEVIWRGPLWFFQKINRSTALYLVLSAIFTLGYALSHVGGPAHLFLVFLSGAASAALVKITGRLWPAILLHAFLNIKGF